MILFETNMVTAGTSHRTLQDSFLATIVVQAGCYLDNNRNY